MNIKKLVGALLTIAAGLLACWAARADATRVPEVGAPSTRASAYIGPTPFETQPALDTAPPYMPGLWGVAAVSFSNLILPAAMLREFDDLESPILDTCCSPLYQDGAVNIWATAFADSNRPAGSYWELVSDPIGQPGYLYWSPAIPPSFEIAGGWPLRL